MPRTGYEGRFTGYDRPGIYTTARARQLRYWTTEEKQRIQGTKLTSTVISKDNGYVIRSTKV